MSYSLEERRFFKFIRESFFNKKDFKKKLKKSYEENNQKLSKDHILADTSEIIFSLLQIFIIPGKKISIISNISKFQ